jgi:hypothetical protein
VSKVIVSTVIVSTVIVSKVIVPTMIPMNKFYADLKLGTFKQTQQSFVYKKILHIPLQHRQTQKLEAIKTQSVACWTRQRVNQNTVIKTANHELSNMAVCR